MYAGPRTGSGAAYCATATGGVVAWAGPSAAGETTAAVATAQFLRHRSDREAGRGGGGCSHDGGDGDGVGGPGSGASSGGVGKSSGLGCGAASEGFSTALPAAPTVMGRRDSRDKDRRHSISLGCRRPISPRVHPAAMAAHEEGTDGLPELANGLPPAPGAGGTASLSMAVAAAGAVAARRQEASAAAMRGADAGLAACAVGAISESAPLRDAATWPKPPPTPSRPLSHVALLFESRRELCRGSPEEDIDAVLGDLADSVLQSCHTESQRHLPATAELTARLPAHDRESILNWLVQACDIMRFHDTVLYSTILTLDRYCAQANEPLTMERLQKVLMAVICTVLKTCVVQDEVNLAMSLRDRLLHLCRQQVPFQEILAMEYQVLQSLRYEVSAPSPLDFLDAFCAPFAMTAEFPDMSLPRCLANFLLQLSFFNAQLHYGYPHAILTAAAIYVALCSLRAAPRLVQVLLDDVAAACPQVFGLHSSVASCSTELHAIWLEFAASQGARVPSLLQKFGTGWPGFLTPPAAGSLPHPAAFCGGAGGAGPPSKMGCSMPAAQLEVASPIKGRGPPAAASPISGGGAARAPGPCSSSSKAGGGAAAALTS